MLPCLLFGIFTTVVVVYGLISIAMGKSWSPLAIAIIGGIGVVVIVLGATGALTGFINSRNRKSH